MFFRSLSYDGRARVRHLVVVDVFRRRSRIVLEITVLGKDDAARGDALPSCNTRKNKINARAYLDLAAARCTEALCQQVATGIINLIL